MNRVNRMGIVFTMLTAGLSFGTGADSPGANGSFSFCPADEPLQVTLQEITAANSDRTRFNARGIFSAGSALVNGKRIPAQFLLSSCKLDEEVVAACRKEIGDAFRNNKRLRLVGKAAYFRIDGSIYITIVDLDTRADGTPKCYTLDE